MKLFRVGNMVMEHEIDANQFHVPAKYKANEYK